MKNIFYFSLTLLFTLFATFSGAQKATKKKSAKNKVGAATEMIDVTAVISGTGGSLGIFQFDGIGFKTIRPIAATSGDTFRFQLPKEDIQVYYLGKGNKQKRPMVIGPDPVIHLVGNLKSIRQSQFIVADFNQKYDTVIQQISNNKRELRSVENQMRRAGGDAQKMEELKNRMMAIDQRKQNQVEALKEKEPFLAKLASLDNFQSYATNTKNYPNVLEHYIHEFFSAVDLTDPGLDPITYSFEVFREYATTISSVGIPTDKVKEIFNKLLSGIPADGQTYKNALGGIILALQQKNHPAFIEYAGRFYEKYKGENQPHTLALGNQIKSAQRLMVGGEAPDFTQNTPEGEALKLSDLRGKVILVDFWASWCGPCRKENPHVVALYNKYKDKGFDILGVSLDNSKDRWLGAIDKDGLTWNHVSDLKGWKNAAAAKYSVRSIPSTFLLNEKGEIIARNLRGAALDGQLKEIFGF